MMNTDFITKHVSFKKGLSALVVSLFLIALLLGYFLAHSQPFLGGLACLLSALLLVLSIFYIRANDTEVRNKYYWYEQLLDAVPTPLSVTDLDMSWTFINKPASQLFDKPQQDFIGKPCHNWGATICQTDKCGIWRLKHGQKATLFAQFNKEFRVETSYLYNLQGEPIGHVEVCRDITAVKGLARAAQIEKQSKLEIEQAYNELKTTQHHLIESQKMASLGELVAGVAHEMNTPIGVCVTASSIIEEQLQELLGSDKETMRMDETLGLINTIYESNNIVMCNLERAVEQIRSFKQVAVDQITETSYRFSMAENLHHVVTSLKHELKKKQVMVDVTCDSSLAIHNSPGVLTQIYTNLILNSIIHGFDDDAAQNRIDICVELDKQYVHIQYSDNGRGVDPEILHKVFEPFVTTKRGLGGTGLGTSIVYNLVTHKLKGKISCTSEPNQGCHFDIKIPAEGQIDIIEKC